MMIGSTPTQPKKNWTVLVWAASDNNLYPYEINDLDKMERVANPDINLLATIDHGPNPEAGGPRSMQRLELKSDHQSGLNSTVKAEVPRGNMADPEALADFVRWGVKNYPAEHYWLVVSDHGDAWHGACEDDSHQSWMTLPGIESALYTARQDTGVKLDVVSFDCCYMASAEVAHQLQNETRYLVASEEAMGYKGIDYDNLLPAIQKLGPKETVERLVSISGLDQDDIQTFSAVDLARIPALTQSLEKLGQAIVASPKSGAQLRKMVAGSEAFETYRDVYALAERFQADPGMKSAAQEVKAAVKHVMVAERHSEKDHPNAHGIQVELAPDTTERGIYRSAHIRNNEPLQAVAGSYAETAFERDTSWSKAIAKLHS